MRAEFGLGSRARARARIHLLTLVAAFELPHFIAGGQDSRGDVQAWRPRPTFSPLVVQRPSSRHQAARAARCGDTALLLMVSSVRWEGRAAWREAV
jgi:hypothetical protein